MNMNRLINMGVRMLMNKGIDVASRRGKRPEDMTRLCVILCVTRFLTSLESVLRT